MNNGKKENEIKEMKELYMQLLPFWRCIFKWRGEFNYV